MNPRLEKSIERWVTAGILDAATTARIRAFEGKEERGQGLRWPVVLALAFGGIMMGAGVLLFVAAHWDNLSPNVRFLLALLLVFVFHAAGAALTEKFPALSTVMHAIGTIALGAGIFLSGQIFNMEEHWPSGLMMWAAGAWIGWALLRDWPQATLAAILTPAWLAGEWTVAMEQHWHGEPVEAQGLLLLAITYLTARDAEHESHERRGLTWLGALGLIPFTVWVLSSRLWYGYWQQQSPAPVSLFVIGWTVGLGLPLALAVWLRGRAARWNFVAALWVTVLGAISTREHLWFIPREYFDWPEILRILWCAAGAIGLVAWGLHEKRKERINLGVMGFGLTVMWFYFSSLMDKLGKSASLIALGLLFMVGGWFLEKARRRLVARMENS